MCSHVVGGGVNVAVTVENEEMERGEELSGVWEEEYRVVLVVN